MNTASRPPVNHLGRDVAALVPPREAVAGMIDMGERDAAIWRLAQPYLQTRANDAHSLYAWGIARALLDVIPDAQEHIVLPAILLHDSGWSTVDEREALESIAPGVDKEVWGHLTIQHEKEGARIAREILTEVGLPAADIDEIAEIIDGHDTRLTALSLNDAVVKDADKLWRVSPHGVATGGPRFGLWPEESLRLNASRADRELFTPEAKAMSRVLVALACVDQSEERANCYVREDDAG
jgi:Predicted HD superfamily hydrolase